MCLIPNYYCDRCGHAFNVPVSYNYKSWRLRGSDSDDERCPKCLNPDFEPLIQENYEQIAERCSDTSTGRNAT